MIREMIESKTKRRGFVDAWRTYGGEARGDIDKKNDLVTKRWRK